MHILCFWSHFSKHIQCLQLTLTFSVSLLIQIKFKNIFILLCFYKNAVIQYAPCNYLIFFIVQYVMNIPHSFCRWMFHNLTCLLLVDVYVFLFSTLSSLPSINDVHVNIFLVNILTKNCISLQFPEWDF